MATYVVPQATVVTQQPVVGGAAPPVIVVPGAAAAVEPKRDGPNMGNKQNVYVWVSDECGCCNDCCICEPNLSHLSHLSFTFSRRTSLTHTVSSAHIRFCLIYSISLSFGSVW